MRYFVPFLQVAEFFFAVTQHFAHRAVGVMFLAVNTKNTNPDLRILENRAEEQFV
jgi:hypothetical protein